ncbi:hypothetical protein [uncultured Pontibacter sp.]|uniref:hypothetical protein n=1 Tax=uncultured Pontibacter sp. TaxID=453356 RepID=UPI00260D750A|nr:hypothetical protein [uncultured Pontibacter sp.]
MEKAEAAKITNNLDALTPREKRIIKKSVSYRYWYGEGVIWLYDQNYKLTIWDCSYSTQAQDYLNNLGIKEAEL